MSVWTVTGYKPYELGVFQDEDPAVYYIKKALEQQIRQLLDEGMEWIIISGQLGVECWAAEVVFSLQPDYPELKLAVLTPFMNQQDNWKEETREYYEKIISGADFVASVSNQPYTSPQQFRNKNELMLRKSSGLLIIYDEEKEGTPKYLFQMARKWRERQSYEIRQVTFYDLQAIVDEEQSNNVDWE
ncbi:DUF1273 domain-containing protein [Bacillus xiapuensis]|uniref:DUF1273 domain-containing protein n=1 Tax=Bacillus xiapuensis TaxID=2014075 RepID=UPI000C24E11B|nr:DUF1273 domain-containing protein [Bacillus xiapuensis]